jgi:hypothetical protein
VTVAWMAAGVPAQVAVLLTVTLGVGLTVNAPDAEALLQPLLSVTTTL